MRDRGRLELLNALCSAPCLLFGFIALVNSLHIKFSFGFSEKDLRIALMGLEADRLAWLASALLAFSIPILLAILRRRAHWVWAIWHLALASIFSICFRGGATAPAVAASALAALTSPLALGGPVARSRVGMALAPSFALLALAAIEAFSCAALASMALLRAHSPAGPFTILSIPQIRWTLAFEFKYPYALYPIFAWLVVLFALSWLSSPIAHRASAEGRSMGGGSPRLYSIWPRAAILLWAGLSLGAIAVYFPYFSPQHPPKLVGVDSPWYLRNLERIAGIESLFELFQAEPRALSLSLLYGIKVLSGAPSISVIQAAPILLMALSALSTFWLVKIGSGDSKAAALAGLLSIFSVQLAVGMYAGIYANWLALSIMALHFGSVLKASRSRRWLIPSAALACLLFAAHSWTGALAAAILGLYFLFNLPGALGGDKESLSALLASGALLVFEAILALSLLGATKALPYAANFLSFLSPSNALAAISNLRETVATYVAGFLFNPAAFLMGALGIFGARGKAFRRLLSAWLAPCSALMLMAGPFYQWRAIYVMPIPALAALGLIFALELFERCLGEGPAGKRVLGIEAIAALFFILLNVNYALRCMAWLSGIAF
ncbi:MAG: hypothetical protein QW645_02105 [Candidatus Bathyarchaeia archaeon]